MKQPVVTINLHEYNQLKNFHKSISDGKIVRYDDYYGLTKVLTQRELIEDISKVNSEMREEYDEVFNEKVTRLKRMSIWEFIKWRRK